MEKFSCIAGFFSPNVAVGSFRETFDWYFDDSDAYEELGGGLVTQQLFEAVLADAVWNIVQDVEIELSDIKPKKLMEAVEEGMNIFVHVAYNQGFVVSAEFKLTPELVQDMRSLYDKLIGIQLRKWRTYIVQLPEEYHEI